MFENNVRGAEDFNEQGSKYSKIFVQMKSFKGEFYIESIYYDSFHNIF
jgi:hypothetical protein